MNGRKLGVAQLSLLPHLLIYLFLGELWTTLRLQGAWPTK
jgi:hypothetical protein